MTQISFKTFSIITAAILVLQFIQSMINTLAVVMITQKRATFDYSAITITAICTVGNVGIMLVILLFLYFLKIFTEKSRIVPVADIAVLSSPPTPTPPPPPPLPRGS